jgi:cbb3-type cytochrome oxidase subunit 3
VAAIAVLDGDPQTLSGGQIAGIVIGTVAGAIILAAYIWYLLKRRQKIRVSTAVEAPEAEDLESK